MQKRIAVTTDSTVDLPKSIVEKYNITVCPLYVEMEGKVYPDDGVSITPEMMYDSYERTGKICHSSACNVADYVDIFTKVKENCDQIIHVGLSEELSCSVRNARMAAEEVGDVFVVDSRNLSTGIALVTLTACDLIAEGKLSAEEIAEKLNEMTPRVDVSFIIDTLDYLHAGGRCSSLARLGANLLKLKPSIIVREGAMSVGKKFRGTTESARIKYGLSCLHDPEDIIPDRLFFTHSGRLEDEQIKVILDEVKKIVPFKEVEVTKAGCVISAHCGPGTYGLLFVRKTPIIKD